MSEAEMVEVKTANLIGPALDWAVAKAVPQKHWPVIVGGKVMLDTDYDHIPYSPSTTWQDGGPLIEMHCQSIAYYGAGSWYVDARTASVYSSPTPLVAICRAVVAVKLGCTVQIPKELMQ